MLNRNAGFGLIEALVSVVVLSLGLSTLMVLYFASTTQQAKPVQILQANYLAQNYLDHIIFSNAWQFCKPNDAQSLCQYINSKVPLPIVREEFSQFKLKISVSSGQEMASIKMKNVEVSIYWQQDELANMNAWVAAQ
ncbi:MAG: type II secretion system protein [Gammaproteobacteria bacterium]